MEIAGKNYICTKQVYEGLKLYRFPEIDWAMFSARGPLPDSLQILKWETMARKYDRCSL